MMRQFMDQYILYSRRGVAARTSATQIMLLKPLGKPGQVTITDEGIWQEISERENLLLTLHKTVSNFNRRVTCKCSRYGGNFLRYNDAIFDVVTAGKVKVKVTLVQALRLCTGRTAHRGSRVIALPFHDHDTRRGWGVSVTPRPLFTPGKKLVPIAQEAGWAPGPVWTGAENLPPHRDSIPGPSSP